MKKYLNIIKIISKELSLVDDEIQRIVSSFPAFFTRTFSDIAISESKKIRSAVTILFLKALADKVSEKQIKICALVEILHNASLIHDDVVDNSSKRRNKPSFQQIYGNKKAVLSGDFLLSVCLKELSLMNECQIIQIFADAMLNICCGEIFQLDNIKKIPSLDKYLLKSEQKTAELFKTAIVTSLLAEKQSEYIPQALAFAKNFGIAFQIHNDIKNVIQNAENNDIQNGIYTAPVIYSQNPEKPFDGIEKSKCLLNNYLSEAKNAVSGLKESEYKTATVKLLELYNE